ncbi:MAG: hypothetical protein Kow0075_08350 [Salibacteraceae bacterium]
MNLVFLQTQTTITMKYLIVTAAISMTSVFCGCSTCYRCSEEVVLYDDNTGQPIDTTENVDEFCTADSDEVTSRENDGARCEVN